MEFTEINSDFFLQYFSPPWSSACDGIDDKVNFIVFKKNGNEAPFEVSEKP